MRAAVRTRKGACTHIGTLRDDLAALATRISAEVMKRTVAVWIREDAQIHCTALAEAPPSGELMGTYTAGVGEAAIEEDLAFVRAHYVAAAALFGE